MTPADHSHMVVLGGPNGAGKTTASKHILRDTLAVEEFVNADIIAQGLSGFAPERAALTAGRMMLTRLSELAQRRADFAFETTLASRTFAPWIRERQRIEGYAFHLVLLWVPSAEFAVERVAERVRKGGHSVPADVVRRRYHRGIQNFLTLYRPMASTWRCYDSSSPVPRLLASGGFGVPDDVLDSACWTAIQRTQDDPTEEA
jgi:predicted ABC-type ATPase